MEPRFTKLFLALIMLKLTNAEIAAGKCPKLNQTFNCNEHFLMKKQRIWTPLAFLPSTIETEAMTLFSFKFTNLNHKRGLFYCSKALDKKSIQAETLEVSIVSENPKKRLGIIISIYKNRGVPQLNKVPDKCKRKVSVGISYRYLVLFKEGEYLLIFGCLRMNETFHDRGFWIFGVNQNEGDKQFVLKKAFKDSN